MSLNALGLTRVPLSYLGKYELSLIPNSLHPEIDLKTSLLQFPVI